MKKGLVKVTTSALALSMLLGSAMAEEATLKTYGTYDFGTEANIIQIDLAALDRDADIDSITIQMSSTKWQADWGVGGSAGLGLNTEEDWVQWDFDNNPDKADRDPDSSAVWVQAMTDEQPFIYTFDVTGETPYIVEDDDPESETYGQMKSAGIIQLGWWWVAGNAPTLDSFVINFTDGTSYVMISSTGTGTYSKVETDAIAAANLAAANKEKRENDAAEILADFDDLADLAELDVVTLLSAAQALKDLQHMDLVEEDLRTIREDLADKKAEAEAALAALQEGDARPNTDIYDVYEDMLDLIDNAIEEYEDALVTFYAENGAKIEALEAKVAALEKEKKALEDYIATGGNASSGGGTDSGKSPKTADGTMVLVLALLATLSIGGVVIAKKARA